MTAPYAPYCPWCDTRHGEEGCPRNAAADSFNPFAPEPPAVGAGADARDERDGAVPPRSGGSGAAVPPPSGGPDLAAIPPYEPDPEAAPPTPRSSGPGGPAPTSPGSAPAAAMPPGGVPRRPGPDDDPLGLRDDADPLGLFRAKSGDTASLPVVGPDPDDLDRFPGEASPAAGPGVEVPLLPPAGSHRAPRRRKRVLAAVAAVGVTALTAPWLASHVLGGGGKPTNSVADDATHFSDPTQDVPDDAPPSTPKDAGTPESPARHAKPPAHADRAEPGAAAPRRSTPTSSAPTHTSASSKPSASKTSATPEPPRQAEPPKTTSPSPSDSSSDNDDHDSGGIHLWPLF